MGVGSISEEAARFAVTALGDAKAANRQYRSVLLTSAEARMLRDGNWEARVVCSRPWLKWLLPAIPVVAFLAATAFFLAGAIATTRVLLAGGIAMSLVFVAPFLPLYTPSHARVFRVVKFLAMIGALWLALQWSWLLLILCVYSLAWTEWTRVSIRRKLPVAEWPKQLYL